MKILPRVPVRSLSFSRLVRVRYSRFLGFSRSAILVSCTSLPRSCFWRPSSSYSRVFNWLFVLTMLLKLARKLITIDWISLRFPALIIIFNVDPEQLRKAFFLLPEVLTKQARECSHLLLRWSSDNPTSSDQAPNSSSSSYSEVNQPHCCPYRWSCLAVKTTF